MKKSVLSLKERKNHIGFPTFNFPASPTNLKHFILSVLRGHLCFFSFPPQRPMTSNFEVFRFMITRL